MLLAHHDREVLLTKLLEYVLRTEESLPNDLVPAVSWSWSEGRGSIAQAFLHGCRTDSIDDSPTDSAFDTNEAGTVRRWLDAIPEDESLRALKHPLLPALLLGEMQLDRHRGRLDNYTLLFENLFEEIWEAADQPHLAEHLTNEQISKWLHKVRTMFTGYHSFRRLIIAFIWIIDTLLRLCDESLGPPSADHDFGTASESIASRFRELRSEYSAIEDKAQYLLEGVGTLVIWPVRLAPGQSLYKGSALLSLTVSLGGHGSPWLQHGQSVPTAPIATVATCI